MIYFLATFTVFLLVVAGMAIGYIFDKKTIRGSCGGLASIGIDKECDCPDPCDKRLEKEAQQLRTDRLMAAPRII